MDKFFFISFLPTFSRNGSFEIEWKAQNSELTVRNSNIPKNSLTAYDDVEGFTN